MATATATVPTTASLADVSKAELIQAATAAGLTVKSRATKLEIAQAIADHAATVEAAKPKKSAVRTDITPADVKPSAEEIARKISVLEEQAARMLHSAVTDSVMLAVTLAKLYVLKPWKVAKVDIKAYFEAHGLTSDNYIMPTDARRVLESLVWRGELSGDLAERFGTYVEGATFTAVENAPVEHMVIMTASSPRSIQRDRDALGIANKARQESHAGQGSKATADKPAKPAATATATAVPSAELNMVYSMTGVREFIASLDDTDMLDELSDLIAECKARLSK
jgi:hypothetical protein